MKRAGIVAILGLLLLGLTWSGWTKEPRKKAPSQTDARPDWIWFDEGDPLHSAPAATRYFRKVFNLSRSIDEATLDVTADDGFTVWLNGREVGSGDTWKHFFTFDVKQDLVSGKNVFAVRAHNDSVSPAGLVVRLSYAATGATRSAVVSDGSWRASREPAPGWEKVDFDDSKWVAAKDLGAFGEIGPWKVAAKGHKANLRFEVPAGFRVEQVARNPKPGDPFSLINMTFDNKGRLLVSQERGPILLCTEPNKEGVLQNVRPYCEQVTNCHGMCWIKDALFLVGHGPTGDGLYRVRDTKNADKTDEVKLIHKVTGSMGEHGPHAILHGPDGWLYWVIGNHAVAQCEKLAANSPLTRWPNGRGPDQGQPGSTEDVLLPRQNDPNGHAANITAPGGTIWRFDAEGRNMGLVAGGFRNHFDAAFSPRAELFTFDSDMEWDEGLPWYRPVRICHCPPGADLGWRTGSANMPAYYLDTLPAILDVGRGSPVGMEFYDHHAFPEKYRGACFMADWSLGILYAVHLERKGASYKATAERFCTGNPMNITDVGVGPDGALYFVMGGRGTQGGIYRIVYEEAPKETAADNVLKTLLNQPQPLAAWSRAQVESLTNGNSFPGSALAEVAQAPTHPVRERIPALDLLQSHGPAPEAKLLLALLADPAPDLRAHAVWLLGVQGYPEGRDVLVKALKDDDALVRRRACEALLCAGIEPPVDALWPLLGESDIFVCSAARLVLERIDPRNWVERIWTEKKDHIALEGIITLGKINQAALHARQIFDRLAAVAPVNDEQEALDWLRTIEFALFHTTERPPSVTVLAKRCYEQFPASDWRINRELAILLTYFRRDGLTDQPVQAKLLDALKASKDDRPQQIHYFYCLRLLHDGWTPAQKTDLLAWYNSTADWGGGHSFTGFLENILRDANPMFTPADRAAVLAQAEKLPWTATALLRLGSGNELPSPQLLADAYIRLLEAKKDLPHGKELQAALADAMGRSRSPEAEAALRRIADKDPSQRDAVAGGLARSPSPENWPYLVRGLEAPNKLVLFKILDALQKIPTKPKPEDPAPYRALLLSSSRLDAKNRWKVVEVLRHWSNNKQFGADKGDWEAELNAWSRWFAQTFPKEPALPHIGTTAVAESKYKFEDLLDFLTKDPNGLKGDPVRGRVVFEKAQCIKCHRYGKEGEGIGPDLTTVSKRFKRFDTLESIIYPSKVISDQYRATVVVTKNGEQINGIVAPQADVVSIVQSDGSKITIKKTDIEQQFASLVSIMPEKLLDPLTKQEIADLFIFLESEPK